MIWQRVQAVAVVLFVLAIGVAVAVLLMRLDRSAPSPIRPTRDVTEDIESAAKDPVGRVGLVAGTGDLLLRTRAGSCTKPGGPELELSHSRGYRFGTVRLPQVDEGTGVSASSPTVRAIAWAKVVSRYKITVAAADGSCKLRQYETSDGGETWKSVSSLAGEWHIDPASGGAVSPKGAVDPGCRPVQLVRISDSTAKVFCPDGTIRTTSDGGATWLDVGVLKKVSSAVFTGPLVGFASTERPACKSRIQSTVDGGLTWTPRGCVEKMLSIPAFTATKKRLTAGGLGGVRLSGDGGATWKPPPPKF